MKAILPLILAAFGIGPLQAQIYADFETSAGPFTMILDKDFNPRGVANFIRLAEGLVPWIDTSTGRVGSGPFYNGQIFYSANPNIEVASGSPGGGGNDGPGWIIRDDCRALINSDCPNSFQTAFSVYMDNDGPNSNGSRFFISLTPVVQRAGNYVRIGEVLQLSTTPGVNGRLTVSTISNTPAGFVTIFNVTMRYVGVVSQGFRTQVSDPGDPVLSTLPSARNATFTFRKEPHAIFLDWDNTPGSIAQLWSSLDLRNWIGPFSAMNVPGSSSFGLDLTASIQASPKAFFYGAVADYPEWPSTDPSRHLPGASILVNYSNPCVGPVSVCLTFDPSGTFGTYVTNPYGNGTFVVNQNDVTGPFKSVLDVDTFPGFGFMPRHIFVLHYDHNGATNTITNPSRMSVQVINSAPLCPGIVGPFHGKWLHTFAPCQ